MSVFNEVTVLCVTYNSAHLLPKTLPALASLAHVKVFDNASGDGTADVARALLPQAQVTASPRNLGFGGANNAMLETVTTPFALLLNPDCVLDPVALTRLLEAAARYPDAAMLAPRLRNRDGRPECGYRRDHFSHDPDEAYTEPDGDVCSDMLSAAALLIRMDLMRPVGFFDPWFFIYYEDDDLCLRARRAGYALVLVQDALMTHFVGSSSVPSNRQMYRKYFFQTLSQLYIERKYRGNAMAARTALAILLENGLKLVPFMLILNRRMVVRSLGRLAGLFAAAVRLSRPFSGDPA